MEKKNVENIKTRPGVNRAVASAIRQSRAPRTTLEKLQKEQGPLTDEQKEQVEKAAAEQKARIDAALNELALEQAKREGTNVFDVAARYAPIYKIEKKDGKQVARITLEPRQKPTNAPAPVPEANNRAKRRREAKKAAKIKTVNFHHDG